MVIYGYVKDTYYSNDGVLQVKVRIPSIHGPYEMKQYNGKQVRNYVQDKDLPYYDSLLLPYIPKEGEVVALSTMNSGENDYIVLGLTGGSYQSGKYI